MVEHQRQMCSQTSRGTEDPKGDACGVFWQCRSHSQGVHSQRIRSWWRCVPGNHGEIEACHPQEEAWHVETPSVVVAAWRCTSAPSRSSGQVSPSTRDTPSSPPGLFTGHCPCGLLVLWQSQETPARTAFPWHGWALPHSRHCHRSDPTCWIRCCNGTPCATLERVHSCTRTLFWVSHISWL